jgi:tetratricopeptide (TPR) repeat protein
VPERTMETEMTEAEQKRQSLEFLETSLASAEAINGKGHPATLLALHSLAEHYLFNQNYEHAEELLLRAAAIAGTAHDADADKLARQKLAWLKFLQGHNDDARAFLIQVADLARGRFSQDSACEDHMTHALRSLIYFYLKTGWLTEAEQTLNELLGIFQQHPTKKNESNYQVAFALVSLAVIADARTDSNVSKQYADKAAEIIRDKCAIGYTVDFLSLAEIINLYFIQERKAEAQELVACTMLECEDTYWPHNPVAGDALTVLAEYLRGQRKFKQAESVYKRAIAIREFVAGGSDTEYARLVLNLCSMYLGMRKYADAEPLVKSAMKARVKVYGVEHPGVAACAETYATILRKTKRIALANKLDFRAREIRSACVTKLDRETAAKV